MSVADVKEIAQSVFENNFPKLKEQAEIKAKKNIQLFIGDLSRKVDNDLSKEEINKFRDPDIQYVLYEAIKSNARKNSEKLRENLSALIVKRIQNDDKDLKRIVYNEAIETIGKLTVNQLKILTLHYLLTYTTYRGISNWATFNSYLNTSIKPFLDFKNTNADFQHLQYASCANISIGSVDISGAFRNRYSLLFLNKIDNIKVDELKIEENLRQQILFFSESENKYKFKFLNKENLEKFLSKQRIPPHTKEKIINLYQNNVKSSSEIEKKIIEETDIGENLLKKWKETPLKNMSLTSVGIVIAATHFEQIVGQKIDMKKWIS